MKSIYFYKHEPHNIVFRGIVSHSLEKKKLNLMRSKKLIFEGAGDVNVQPSSSDDISISSTFRRGIPGNGTFSSISTGTGDGMFFSSDE
jgi:hypothetical protein